MTNEQSTACTNGWHNVGATLLPSCPECGAGGRRRPADEPEGEGQRVFRARKGPSPEVVREAKARLQAEFDANARALAAVIFDDDEDSK